MLPKPMRSPAAICFTLASGWAVHSGAADPLNPPSLATVEQVREITPEQADKHYPVHLRGVVTFSDWNADRGMFLQDQTAGIYVGLPTGDVPVGEEVEVDGTTAA